MTREEREEEIVKAAEKILEGDPRYMTTREIAFVLGAHWADSHPHWISVEDELPPRWETNPNVSVPVITFGTLGESSIPCVDLQRYHFGEGKWQYSNATHWMPFQYPKKGGEE